MVSIAGRKIPAGRFQAADMRSLDFAAGSWDAVLAFYSIIHVPRADQPALFSNIRRWLSSGGHFVACLSSGDLRVGQEADWLDAGPMFWSGFDADTNLQLVSDAGFDIIDAAIIPQMEEGEEVRFLWIEAEATAHEVSDMPAGSRAPDGAGGLRQRRA